MREDCIMKKIFFYVISAALLLACSKETAQIVVPERGAMIHKSFTVLSDDTKTYMDGMSVKWAANDSINVVAYTTGNQYTFKLTSGEDTSAAVFEGEIDPADAGETKFIAVYPDVNVQINKDGSDPSKDIIEFLGSASDDGRHIQYFISESTPVKAVKDGFDGRYAPMTAVLDGTKFVFRHGAAYFKVKIGVEGVKTVKLQSSGSARFNGRPKYVLETGLNSTVESAKNNVSASPADGTFEKDGVYYIPALTKQSNVATLTITYTLEDGTTSKSMQTTALNSIKLTAGKIYDLGCPPITFPAGPEIVPVAPAKLEADATNGSFTYSVNNPDGVSSVTASKKSGDWISDVAAADGTVTFNCTANTGEERTAVITLTYPGAEDVDVTVTQKSAVVLVPVTATKSWASAFTELKASYGTGEVTESFIYDNLGFVAGGGKFKFNTDAGAGDRVQLGGTGSLTKNCLEFLVGGPGILSIVARSSGDSARTLAICLDGAVVENTANNAPDKTSDTATIEVPLGTATSGQKVSIYSQNSAINIYDITWIPLG